nr:AAA family ATPase [Burkholderia multivorans]
MAYAKVGLYGSAGSGKTRTASEIAIGLHKAIGSTKPIAAFDTEPAFSFVLPLFEHAGIELLVADESRALSDLMDFMDEAEKACDIVIIDSITHVWRDAQESYLRRMNETRKKYGKKPLGALEFQHWRPIKAAWAEFTDRFLSSKMHVIVCGRAGQVYEYQDKDDGSGKKELISTGTRMATEKELGYEPSLLIEMIADRRDGYIVNTAVIQKDRADRLNGREIEKPDYAKLEGHFQALNIGGQHFDSMDRRDSQNMFPDADESGWDAEKRNREIWCEEIAELLKKYYPSQTADDKKSRQDLIEQFFDTRSWTRVEGMKADLLKQAYEDMRAHLEEKFSDALSQPAEGSDTAPEQEAA